MSLLCNGNNVSLPLLFAVRRAQRRKTGARHRKCLYLTVAVCGAVVMMFGGGDDGLTL